MATGNSQRGDKEQILIVVIKEEINVTNSDQHCDEVLKRFQQEFELL